MSFPYFLIVYRLNNNTLTLLNKRNFYKLKIIIYKYTCGSNFDVSHITKPDVPSLNTIPIPFNSGENSICFA